MTRRNQKRFSTRTQRNHSSEQRLVKMLDVRKLTYFRYDAMEILNSSVIDEKVWTSMLASIVTKASRLGIKEANEYLRQLEKDEVLDIETSKALIRLLDRYKRWR